MRLVKALTLFSLLPAVLLSMGCSQDSRLRAQQRQYQDRIVILEADLESQRDENRGLQAKLTEQEKIVGKMHEESEAQAQNFEKLSTDYEALLKKLGQAGPLPEELNAMLAAFAEANSELLSYDPYKGQVRLKSDVTFNLGSDVVKHDVKPVLAALAQICSTNQAKDCRVLVVGHTDDLPIVRPETRAKHPTNWHLSAHRAIAVMDELKRTMPEDRLAVMGFGQWDPVAPNAANHRGNPLNRRVEIFIVPKESAVPSAGLK